MGRTVENTLRPNTKKGITKEQHITPAFIGRNWVGLLKNTLRPNTKEITKEQHITQSLLSGRNCRTVKYS
jgi:hypothetical protein